MAKVNPLRGARAVAPASARRRAAAGAAAETVPVDIAPLVAQIDAAGTELARDPTGGALERFKRGVRTLLDAAVAESMQVASERSAGLSRRVFSTIARVDVALAELAEAVLGRQQDVLRIGALIDQVKGLLVDLYR